jgi:carbonic anhydrase
MKFPARLVDGYRSFVDTRLPLERSRFEKLAASGQRPEFMVICCCDSRVSPEVIFDAHPGEMFVVRNIANLVPPHSPNDLSHGVFAALEFAVQVLKVKHIIVMGHTHCGGIRAYAEHRDRLNLGDFIDSWMSMIASTAKSLGEDGDDHDYLSRLERASIVATMGNLLTFPWIKSRVAARELELIGAYFDVGTGALTAYDPASRAFAAVDGEIAGHIAAPAAE